jgi:hypothetical protein
VDAEAISLISRASGGEPETGGSWLLWPAERSDVSDDEKADARIARIISEIPQRRRREHFYPVAA